MSGVKVNKTYIKALRAYKGLGGEKSYDKGNEDVDLLKLRKTITEFELQMTSAEIIASIKEMCASRTNK